MKHIISNKLFLLGLTLTMAASCSKKLDTKPTISIDQQDALKTSSDVKVALVGAYADLGVADFYGGRIFVGPDLLGDFNELNWSGTYQGMTQIKNKAIPVDNGFITSTWEGGYRAINDVNNVLGAISVVNDNDKSKVEGESKFIRAAALFDLVRVFAKAWDDGDPTTNPGVPVVLTPTTGIDKSNLVKRNTVSEVYAQVITDLTDAENKLPEENGFFATKAAASALLARVYLQKGDFENAANAADAAINSATSNNLSLENKYANAFPYSAGNSVEDIFAMQVTSSSGYNSFQEFYSSLGRGDIQIKEAHLALYESGDDRLNLFYESGGSIYTGKFDYVYGNVHTIRLAEMYLIRAEANFRMNSSTGAFPVDDINRIRERAGLSDYASEDLTLDKILKERKLELAFEGFTLHDVKRLKGSVGPLSWDSPKLVYPIPLRELRVNPNLTQNEGYN